MSSEARAVRREPHPPFGKQLLKPADSELFVAGLRQSLDFNDPFLHSLPAARIAAIIPGWESLLDSYQPASVTPTKHQ